LIAKTRPYQIEAGLMIRIGAGLMIRIGAGLKISIAADLAEFASTIGGVFASLFQSLLCEAVLWVSRYVMMLKSVGSIGCVDR
jgi:hypothetical protein